MTRTHLAAVVVSTVIAGARVAEALTITVIAPTPATRIRHNVDVYVNVETAFALTTAQVTLDGTTAQLTPFASCGAACVRLFAELTPAPPEGAKVVAVEVADAGGATATASAPFIFDRPTSVTLALKPGTVVGTAMHLRGTCDDHGAPCAALDLSFHTPTSHISRSLVDVTAFDELFDLTPVANSVVLAVAVGHDGFFGGEVPTSATIYVNDSPRLLPIVQTSGAIQDADLRRVLHVNLYNQSPGPLGISLFDRATATDTQLEVLPTPDGGRLTPSGAVWGTAGNATAIYRSGTVEHFPGTNPRVAGDQLVWGEFVPPVLHRFDVATGAHTQLNNVGAAIPAANGALYFRRSEELIRRDGAGDTLVGHMLDPIATDGNLVVVSRFGVCGTDVYSASGAVDHLDTEPCSTRQDFAWVRDGWVVYYGVRALPGPPWAVFELRSRAPDGTRYLLADNLFELGFNDVSPTGEVMFREGGRRFLVSPGGAPVDVAGGLGRGLWRDGYWLVAIGDTLFGLDVIPPVPAPPDGAPDASPDGAPDARPDAAPDAGPDAAPDASPGAPDAAPGPAPGPAIDAGAGTEADANAGPGAGLRDGGGCGGCSTGETAPPFLLALGISWWLRRRAAGVRGSRRPRSGSGHAAS